MRKLFNTSSFFIILIGLFLNFNTAFSSPINGGISSSISVNISDSNSSGASSSDEHIEEKHEYGPLVFIMMALIIGASTRHILSKIDLPFTVILLLIGLVLGVFGRFAVFDVWNIFGVKLDTSILDQSINWAAHIDPHLILYIFLPILIFEATYAIDVHAFKKSFTNSVMLAVPGIIISIIVTSGLIWLLIWFNVGLDNWYWEITLLLGTVISATDPVAVVSILKELGASKKLSTLIESESLLNDGVAIVIFMVIFLGITGTGVEHAPLIEFVRVAFGGMAIGFIIGKISLYWLKKVKNDVLIEITIILAGAYLSFFISEFGFHTSGVLATVTIGIMMASTGRTRISPSVQHFIHEFWELAAFVANTLIFLIVGIVIAERIIFTGTDLIILFAIYVIIHFARFVSQTILFPIMRKSGYGITMKDSKVLWWGALRGAIGLALALMVEANENIDIVIREEFLFLTAGIVILTLTVNATTMKKLAIFLGMTKVSSTKQYILERANEYISEKSNASFEELKDNKFFKKAHWNEVEKVLTTSEGTSNLVEDNSFMEESRRRILEKEKSNYWHQFKGGYLNSEAYHLLVSEIDEIIDSEGERSLSDRGDLEKLFNTKNTLVKLSSIKFIGVILQKFYLNNLLMCFDAAKGFLNAQEECFIMLHKLQETGNETELEILHKVEAELKENKIQALTFLRKFKMEFPELHEEISTKHASITLLNKEKNTIEDLLKNGQISRSESSTMLSKIESKKRKLKFNSY